MAFWNEFEACDDGAKWAGRKSLKTQWNKCPRPDWMLWALDKIGYRDNRILRLYACACVRGTPTSKGTVWDLLPDERSKNAVVVAERFAEGKATEEERAAAGAAAGAAARAAARDAAWAAARAAAGAAAGATAGATAGAAAWAAAGAAAGDAAWSAAGDAAWSAARAWQADKLRKFISWEEISPLLSLIGEGE